MDNEKKKFAVIVVNDKSGRGKRANVDKLKKTMLKTYDVRVFHITDGEGFRTCRATLSPYSAATARSTPS